jgi:hypothetical protein
MMIRNQVLYPLSYGASPLPHCLGRLSSRCKRSANAPVRAH